MGYIRPDTPHWIWLLTICVTCCAFCILIFVIVIINLLGIDICLTDILLSTAPNKHVKYYSILSLLSFIICLISQVCVVLVLDVNGQVPATFFQQIVQICNLLSWTLAQLFIYLLFIINLQFSFKNTIFKVSKKTMIFLYSSVIIFCIFRFIYITLYILFYNNMIDVGITQISLAICICCTEFIDLILSLTLIYLFVNRLFKLVSLIPHNAKINNKRRFSVTYTSLVYPSKNSDLRNKNVTEDEAEFNNDKDKDKSMLVSSTSHTFNSQQESILFIASKYAILSSVAIFSTQIFLISSAVDALSFSTAASSKSKFYIYSFSIYYSVLSLDCLINSLCICLNFEFNKIWFWTLCCLCDDCCYAICAFITKRYHTKHKRKSYRTLSTSFIN